MNLLIDYTDKAIMKIVLDQVQQMNPWITVGEKLNEPVAVVSGGKVVHVDKYEPPVPANLIPIKNLPGSVALPQSSPVDTVSVRTVKLKMDDIANFRTSGLKVLNFNLTSPAYIYPYLIEIPGRQWLEDYKIGDMVSVGLTDPATFQTVYIETPLTQQMIEDNSEVYFRFALSEK